MILLAKKEENPGCFKCQRKQCVVCQEHLQETNTFHSHVTHETFTIRQRFTCDTTNIVYILFCDKCNLSQYTGQSKNSLKTRFYLHRSHITKNTGTKVTRHFNQTDHSLQNMKCIIIEKVHSHTEKARLQREDFWRKKLRTVAPFGLNTLDD